mmetsp:Transcript_35119/g.70049  ORF Transcript_35119/g.70049 Transcript_35119/m.70049 type:complete len:270 (-) Transcript_35119:634-1443(-)
MEETDARIRGVAVVGLSVLALLPFRKAADGLTVRDEEHAPPPLREGACTSQGPVLKSLREAGNVGHCERGSRTEDTKLLEGLQERPPSLCAPAAVVERSTALSKAGDEGDGDAKCVGKVLRRLNASHQRRAEDDVKRLRLRQQRAQRPRRIRRLRDAVDRERWIKAIVAISTLLKRGYPPPPLLAVNFIHTLPMAHNVHLARRRCSRRLRRLHHFHLRRLLRLQGRGPPCLRHSFNHLSSIGRHNRLRSLANLLAHEFRVATSHAWLTD